MLKDYNEANIYTSEIILDISDQLSSNKNIISLLEVIL